MSKITSYVEYLKCQKSKIAGPWMRLIDLRVIPFLGFDIPTIGGGLSKDLTSLNRINFLDWFKSYSIFSDLTLTHPPIH